VSIITPVSELELREGSLMVGRLPECDVMIDDGLVSRMHARISVRDASVVVEDLHSTNGVYVNGARITHSALLHEGDRLLIGTTEISARSFGELELHLDDLAADQDSGPPSLRSPDLKSVRSRSTGVPSTARADALEVIGALADRLASSGNLDEARRVLSSHLKRILQGATAGLTVPAEVCLLASRHSLSLARWTGQSAWIDYVIELHLAARRIMHGDVCQVFESVALSVGDFDRSLFRYYVDALRQDQGLLTGDELLTLDRLIRLSEA
jgi:hypothetical protein